MTTTPRSTDQSARVPSDRRIEWLSRTPGFTGLPTAVLSDLAGSLSERDYATGDVVIREGDAASELFLITAGTAEAFADSPGGNIPLLHQGPGDLFGEIAAMEPGLRRQASVVATTPLSLLVLGAEAFRQILSAHPDAHAAFATASRDMRLARFLKMATPFGAVDGAALRTLAGRLQSTHIPVGAEILRQGERGRGACLLRSGRVEVVVREDNGSERRICSLGPGALFGEGALLTDAPRSATVRATEPCELLAIHRSDFLEVMVANRQSAGSILELLALRQRPRQRPAITSHTRVNPDGETITVLKDASRGAYFRLSDEGYFLWQRLDGRHTLRDLTLDYLTRFKAFAPQAIASIITGLGDAGFLETNRLSTDVIVATFKPRAWQRALKIATRVLDCKIAIGHVDIPLGVCHHYLRWMFTRPAQAVLAMLAVGGIPAFIVFTGRMTALFHPRISVAPLLWLCLPALLISLIVHELAHGLTVKAFGHAVPRIGIGWYWISPIVFVDTSEMWLAPRWPRIAVTLAGPYSNLLLASVASIAGCISTSPLATTFAWILAAVSYALALINLNPLLEYDGYYLLSDWLEKPNLRGSTIIWLRHEFPGALRHFNRLRGHASELIYTLAMFVFILVALTIILIGSRLLTG